MTKLHYSFCVALILLKTVPAIAQSTELFPSVYQPTSPIADHVIFPQPPPETLPAIPATGIEKPENLTPAEMLGQYPYPGQVTELEYLVEIDGFTFVVEQCTEYSGGFSLRPGERHGEPILDKKGQFGIPVYQSNNVSFYFIFDSSTAVNRFLQAIKTNRWPEVLDLCTGQIKFEF